MVLSTSPGLSSPTFWTSKAWRRGAACRLPLHKETRWDRAACCCAGDHPRYGKHPAAYSGVTPLGTREPVLTYLWYHSEGERKKTNTPGSTAKICFQSGISRRLELQGRWVCPWRGAAHAGDDIAKAVQEPGAETHPKKRRQKQTRVLKQRGLAQTAARTDEEPLRVFWIG